MVLDGLSPRHVDRELMPVLASLAHEGGRCLDGCVGVMPSSTYPNHATFVTGVGPSEHGLVANDIPGDHGPVPSWELGLRVPTLFDAMSAAGRPSAAVFGDHHLVGATGAGRASLCWPRDEHEHSVARDILGYAKDRETAPVVVDVCRQGAELVVAQLNQTDTMAHIFGPDSDEALGQYGRSDSHVGYDRGATSGRVGRVGGDHRERSQSRDGDRTGADRPPRRSPRPRAGRHRPRRRCRRSGRWGPGPRRPVDDGGPRGRRRPADRRDHRPGLVGAGPLLLVPRDSRSRGPREPPHHSSGRRGGGRTSRCRRARQTGSASRVRSSTSWAPAVAQLLGLPFPPDAQPTSGR